MIMAIDDGAPSVETHMSRVGVTQTDPDHGHLHGFLLAPGVAATVAARMLAQVAAIRGDHAPVLEVQSVVAEHRRLDDEEDVVRLILTVEGAPWSLWMDLTRFAEFAAGVTILSREIDRGEPPKDPDRL